MSQRLVSLVTESKQGELTLSLALDNGAFLKWDRFELVLEVGDTREEVIRRLRALLGQLDPLEGELQELQRERAREVLR
jgi:predicted RNase H-like HicB family nuclease